LNVSDRVLLASIYHPELVRGGAQQACYELFAALKGSAYEPVLLASAEPDRQQGLFKSGAVITGFDGRENEYLFLCQAYDHAWHRNREPLRLEKFEAFLRQIAPRVIHFHHFMTFGVEYLAASRRYLDETGGQLVFTFHEFLSICMARGQMVRSFDNSLCERASSVRCHQCFPEFSPEYFTMRRMWMRHHLDMVDVFVAPSQFLKSRYVEWGIAPEKIVHIPNGHHQDTRPVSQAPDLDSADRQRNRFTFFGQLVDNKGLLVLFEAVRILRSRGIEDFKLDVYGANLHFASKAFRDAFEAFWTQEKALSEGGLERARFHGAYELSDLERLMARVDWVIVPSTWWEIFGMVVSEAFQFAKPVICSNIGGIGERVRDNVDGLHFAVGSAEALAEAMTRAMTEPGLWQRLCGNIEPPPTAEVMAARHIELCYGKRPIQAAGDRARKPPAAIAAAR
jgi:glycosyltransferase involved in cell wall biosynthesis